MYLPGDDRRLVVTPQLALRVAIMGGIALALFAVIFFRLWFLQVLSGDRYLAEANDNRVREVKVEAPRGEIVDRNGRVMVDNRTALAVQMAPDRLPTDPAVKAALYARLARVLNMGPRTIDARVSKATKELPFSPVTIKTDVGLDAVLYLQENQSRFPGIQVERVFLRKYPLGELGAHLFGTIGEITQNELKQARYAGVALGNRVGKSGVEYEYDRYLRGTDGASRIQVDAIGRPKGELSIKRSTPGENLRLSVDLAVQKAGQQALGSYGLPGAFVALDPRNGEVLGLGSNPSFDPNVFTKPVSNETYRRLTSEDNESPLTNRAIQGLYPTGSTFKLVTTVATMESGLLTPNTIICDPGSFTLGGITFRNAEGAAYGCINVTRALQVSDDVFYYKLGVQADNKGGDIMQKWARKLGIGSEVGIDLPGEMGGHVPTPAWRNRLYKEKKTDRPWSGGDAVNLATGQGDLQSNPLQMAIAYAAVANGGRVVTPHLGQRVEDAKGRTLQRVQPGPQREVEISPTTRNTIMKALHLATQGDGTSAKVFENFPVSVAGKTGTAVRPGQGDQAWYVAMAPYPNPQIVVATTVERGGYGADTAAPVAKRILQAYLGYKGRRAAALRRRG
ncbi:MAG: penicillin-binding protein 2 [Solirubrobacterales bacterium]